MPELIDELKAVQKSILEIQGELRQLKDAQAKGVDLAPHLSPLQAKLAELEKVRDELRDEIKKIGKPAEPPAPPKPPKGEDDDGNESGFWD